MIAPDVESTFVDRPGFVRFVRSYQHSAFRIEARDNYNDETEAEHVLRFVSEEPDDDSWMDLWLGMILRRTLEGQRMSRVRIVSRPWSNYTRFGLHLSRLNVAAGEDIRYLDRDHASKLGLPDYDYWLIDGHQMCVLRHDDEDRLLGADVIDDPKVVVEHCHYREIAMHHGVTRAQYLKR